MSNDATDPRANSQFEPLTFDASTAPGAANCQQCGAVLKLSYHMLNDSMVCGKCRNAAEAAGAGGSGAAGLMRAIAYGGGAAVLGAAGYYAFVKITNIEWALLTALVGLGVGRAVHSGSRGHGGRKFQIVAVVLTWFAMAGAYLPFMLGGDAKDAKSAQVAAVADHPKPESLRSYADSMAALQATTADSSEAATSGAATAEASAAEHADSVPAATPVPEAKISAGTAILVLLGALALGLVTTPVFVAFASPISGLFIAYALYRAWKSNAGGTGPLTVSGPFRLEQARGGGEPA